MKTYLVRLYLFPVRFYRRFISPLTPPCCRFTPTCSAYAVKAVERFGIIKGTVLLSGAFSDAIRFAEADTMMFLRSSVS